MLTILREEEEWTRVHLQEACLLSASAITKSSLYVHLCQNDKSHAQQIIAKKQFHGERDD